jgi:hypothetical protein
MKNKILFSIVLVAALIGAGSGVAFAKSENGEGANESNQQAQQTQTNQPQDNGPDASVSSNVSGQANQNQNQVQNQGDDSQLQNQNQEQEQEENENQKGGSERAKERRSEVANAVQKLLEVSDSDKTIGEQIRVVAQNQNENHEKLENSLQTVQNRNKFLRFLIGINYGEAKNAQTLLEQSRTRIQELEQLKTQITDSAELAKINEQIKTLQDINTEVDNALKESEKRFSLLGWVFKLFTK